MTTFTTLDLIAIGWFATAWIGFAIYLENGPHVRKSLSWHMDQRRREWFRISVDRENRIMDAAIMSNLMNGTGFFASATIFGIGGCFALMGATERVLQVFDDIPWITTSRGQWEVKLIGLACIFAYAFFKFGWAYRLFNYCSVLLGAIPMMPGDRDAALRAAERAATMNGIAARHFNRGLRAFFFAIGYLGWFAGPEALLLSTTAVLWTVWRRQFLSNALAAVREPL